MTRTHFNLERWQAEMAANRSRIEALLIAHPSDKTPTAGWNIAQCIEHLDITARTFMSQWSRILKLNQRKPGSKYAFWWRWFLRNMEDTSRLRYKTPPPFDPSPDLRLEVVASAYTSTREKVIQLATEMQNAQTGASAVTSPFASWMKYPMDFSFDLVAAHERRHLTQAEAI